MVTLAEKYKEKKAISIKDIILQDVEKALKNFKKTESNRFEYLIGWWETPTFPHIENKYFNMMAGEIYHDEINKIMREEGFKIYEDNGGFRRRAKTIYTL